MPVTGVANVEFPVCGEFLFKPRPAVEISLCSDAATGKNPKGHDVEVLSPDCPDESFNERMRNRQVRYGFDFGNVEYGTAATIRRVY